MQTGVVLSKPRIRINTCCASVVTLGTVNPILSVPYLQFLVAWHRQLIGKIAENELWRCVAGSIKTVKMFLGTMNCCFQVSSRRQDGFFIGICNDSHQTITAIVCWVCTTPIWSSVSSVAFNRPRFVDELHCLEPSTHCDVKGTVLVTSRAKANRICVYLLPVL